MMGLFNKLFESKEERITKICTCNGKIHTIHLQGCKYLEMLKGGFTKSSKKVFEDFKGTINIPIEKTICNNNIFINLIEIRTKLINAIIKESNNDKKYKRLKTELDKLDEILKPYFKEKPNNIYVY